MKYAHSIKLNVFSYEHENSDVILKSFLEFFPFNLEENKVELRKTTAQGFNESTIVIFEIVLNKTNPINKFLDSIVNNLTQDQKNAITEQSESRLDKDLDFFLRFDKDSWINGRKLALTDSGKCFHLKIRVAAFPSRREVALKIIRKLFS